MALKEVVDPLGAPWRHPLRGTLHELVVESDALAGNPLGDPARRPLYVYEAPGFAPGMPAVFLLQAFGKQADMWLTRKLFEPTLVEQLDGMFAEGTCPPALVVLPDAWTSLGGSQFINSRGTGRYMDYICDEIVPFVAERFGGGTSRDQRVVAGHSSGGYGALVTVMKRPEVFGRAGAVAPDTLFEVSLLPDFPGVARTLRDRYEGSFENFFEILEAEQRLVGEMHVPLGVYALAACYSPAPDGTPRLPFDLATGRSDPEVWDEWLRHDPVRLVAGHAAALRSLNRLHIEAGRRDSYHLDLGVTALHEELEQADVPHTFALFDGGHTGITHRFPPLVASLLRVLG